LIFNYMKVLDPGSTVREGEFATAQNAGGISDRVIAKYNNALRGERLAPDVRADFLNRSEMLYKQMERTHGQLREQYTGLAQRRGVDPKNVIVDYMPQGQEQPATATGGGGKEFAAMPDPAKYAGKRIKAENGTIYKSDGKRWVRQ